MVGDRDQVLMAEIGAPHGVKGEVRVKTHCADPAALGAYGPLAIETGGQLTVKAIRPSKTVMIVRFGEVTDRNAAEALKGKRLYIARDQLPDPNENEFYHSDLIGLKAIGGDDTFYGRVVAVHDFGAGPLLEIRPETGPVQSLPFTRDAVPDIRIADGLVIIDPPDGLFDGDDDRDPGASDDSIENDDNGEQS